MSENQEDVEIDEESGYSWYKIMGLMGAFSLVSYATYQYTNGGKNKDTKSLYEDVINENKSKVVSKEKLITHDEYR